MCIYDRVCIITDSCSPAAETIAVRFQILLVVFRHMIRDGAVLPFAAAQATVGGNAVFVVKNFNSCFGYPHHLRLL